MTFLLRVQPLPPKLLRGFGAELLRGFLGLTVKEAMFELKYDILRAHVEESSLLTLVQYCTHDVLTASLNI